MPPPPHPPPAEEAREPYCRDGSCCQQRRVARAADWRGRGSSLGSHGSGHQGDVLLRVVLHVAAVLGVVLRAEDVRQRGQRLDALLLRLDDGRGPRALRLALERAQVDHLAGLLGRLLLGVVLLAPPQVLRVAVRLAHVLEAHVDALLDLALAVHLVHLDTHRALSDVPDHTRAAVVELERHALVLRSVRDDVHALTHLEGAHVRREPDHTLLAEPAREEIARARAHAARLLACVTHRGRVDLRELG
mmetsp:Transcript_41521/g.102462  ORF Transcript_41521/g.102462 Transcript_41521/m.102462 type:complete len:247 (-) Transcript_41521:17-757(-)